ncbi:hypothetical protein RUM44_009909 [Polyplax serrata]|uniref:Rhythmically expressed gene 2 protein n=1 Tax=Polyplax serrata TaxID=468196 RepID=A0ABR1AU07_POLSC
MVPLKLVTFDVTKTLLFFRIPVVEKYVSTAANHDVLVDITSVKKNFHNAWTSLSREHPNFGRDTGLGWENWWAKMVERTFGDVSISEQKIRLIAEDLLKFHSTAEAFKVRPHTKELLDFLRGRDVRLGVVSNYDTRLNTILENVNLRKNFDFVLGSYEFGKMKPDASIFKEALKLGKCSTGDEAVHVGDDVELDYHGARRAGLRAILMLNNEENVDSSGVNHENIFQDFTSLKHYFERNM